MILLLFFMLVLLVENIFLTTFHGLYFNHQLHITIKISQVLTCSWWPSVSSFHVLPLHLSFWCVGTTKLYSSSILLLSFHPDVLQSTNIISLKNSRPCRDLNPGPPQYQADMLPTELSWLGSAWNYLALVVNFDCVVILIRKFLEIKWLLHNVVHENVKQHQWIIIQIKRSFSDILRHVLCLHFANLCYCLLCK